MCEVSNLNAINCMQTFFYLQKTLKAADLQKSNVKYVGKCLKASICTLISLANANNTVDGM